VSEIDFFLDIYPPYINDFSNSAIVSMMHIMETNVFLLEASNTNTNA